MLDTTVSIKWIRPLVMKHLLKQQFKTFLHNFISNIEIFVNFIEADQKLMWLENTWILWHERSLYNVMWRMMKLRLSWAFQRQGEFNLHDHLKVKSMCMFEFQTIQYKHKRMFVRNCVRKCQTIHVLCPDLSLSTTITLNRDKMLHLARNERSKWPNFENWIFFLCITHMQHSISSYWMIGIAYDV